MAFLVALQRSNNFLSVNRFALVPLSWSTRSGARSRVCGAFSCSDGH